MLSIGEAYILEAAMEFWGMANLTDHPTKHVPPAGIIHMTIEKKHYFDAIVGDFFNEFVTPDPETFIAQQQGHTTAGNDVLEESRTESYAPDRIRQVITCTSLF